MSESKLIYLVQILVKFFEFLKKIRDKDNGSYVKLAISSKSFLPYPDPTTFSEMFQTTHREQPFDKPSSRKNDSKLGFYKIQLKNVITRKFE